MTKKTATKTVTRGTSAKFDPMEGFEPGPAFYDMKKFPRGFNKYGEFTREEATLLHSYGRQMLALEKGEKKPVSKAEKQFVAVCRGDCNPQSPLEKAWVKYLDRLNRKPKVINPFGSSTQVSEGDSMVSAADLVEEDLEEE